MESQERLSMVESAYSVLNQWKNVQDKTFDRFMSCMTYEDGHEHWQPPPSDSVKINTDAAIFNDSNCYSHAFVVRNHAGDLVVAEAKCVQGQISPELAEAIAYWHTRSLKLD